MKSLKAKKIILLFVLYIVVVLGFLAILILFSDSDIYDKKNLNRDIVKACIMGLSIFVYDLVKALKKSWNNRSKDRPS